MERLESVKEYVETSFDFLAPEEHIMRYDRNFEFKENILVMKFVGKTSHKKITILVSYSDNMFHFRMILWNGHELINTFIHDCRDQVVDAMLGCSISKIWRIMKLYFSGETEELKEMMGSDMNTTM